jgi:hypothetical protein
MHVVGSFEEAERFLKAGNFLSSEELAALLQNNPSVPPPDVVLDYLVARLLRPLSPLVDLAGQAEARYEFTWLAIRERYQELRQQYRIQDQERRARARSAKHRDHLAKADEAAHERAALAVMGEFAADIGDVTVKRFINKLSEFNSRTVSLEGHVAPDDRDPPDHSSAPKAPRRRKR